MESPKTFQMVVIGVFVVLLILGFLGFSGKLPLPGSKTDINYGTVTLWGTLPSKTMQTLISAKLAGNKSIVINYVEKSMATFNRDLIEALASGQGPDFVLLPQDEMIKNLNKLNPISYQTMPERDFRDTFLPEGEMFLRPDGIVALPFTLDPIVMYWNRDIFANAGVVIPPTLWKQFYDLAPKITARDSNGKISRSFVSFGGYRNVSNAKEILSIFIMQAGSPVVVRKDGVLSAALVIQGDGSGENPVVSAVRFFTEFSKPDKDSYSWNSSLPDSRTMFESGDLATYFGYVSEYQLIQQKNPHLNFDVVRVPQAENTLAKITFGRMHGLAITLASKNPQGALYGELLLTSKDIIEGISGLTALPPVRRDSISLRPADPTLSVFYDSAIIARAWYDPSPSETDALFRNMIEDVVSGKLNMAQALSVVQESMTRLLMAYR
ncbi:MAG: carbohydrate ABC transporter substrate-binding protein [Candidatus Yonathbacteria bacterium]|nr:carbohydrate ABC transporter substrate-binding protein [Candidatus Yonathbacteria bacterium]